MKLAGNIKKAIKTLNEQENNSSLKQNKIIGSFWTSLFVIVFCSYLITRLIITLVDFGTFSWDNNDFNFSNAVTEEAKSMNIISIDSTGFKYQRDITLSPVKKGTDTIYLGLQLDNHFYPIATSFSGLIWGRNTIIAADTLRAGLLILGAKLDSLDACCQSEKAANSNEYQTGSRYLQATLAVIKKTHRNNTRILGFIQIATIFCFAIAICLILLDFYVIRYKNGLQVASFSFFNSDKQIISIEDATNIQSEINDFKKSFAFHPNFEPRLFYNIVAPVFSHITINNGGIDKNQIISVLESYVSSAREKLEARLQILRYFVMTIPSLGFIGTVLGISDALGETSTLIGQSPNYERILANESLSQSLNIAFDTTLVGLVLNIIISFIVDWLEGYEMNFVSAIKDKFINHLDSLK